MLSYKLWLETRWRFAIGLALLVCSAGATVFTYSTLIELLPLVPRDGGDNGLAVRIREAAEVVRDYRGYVWFQWFNKNLTQVWTLFAAVLGTGGLLAQATRGGALFTLSLPVTRARLVWVRAAIGLAELAALALVPSLIVVALSPAIDQSYGVADALVHSACIIVAGSVFFSLASLLSTVFGDVWRPLLLTLLAAFGLAVVEVMVPAVSRFSVFTVMSAAGYFRGDGVPWLGLLASAAASLAMLVGATRNMARQDF
jgi:ABC-type transport system involved in multi-copper enzyme maturation permease subunit